MNMKKTLCLALASISLLSSCGIDSFGKAITSLDDFVTISKIGDSDFNVTKANRVYKKSDTGNDTSLGFINHNAELYSGGDFVYEETTKYTGFTIHYDVDTYFLITGEKSGIVSERSEILDDQRDMVKNAIKADYSAVLSCYDEMKKFTGKGSSTTLDGVSYSNVSLTLADADSTLGYTLRYTYSKGNAKRTEDHYITLDKKNGKWGISYYSHRVTDLINGEETYYVMEYQFTCLNDAGLNANTLGAKNNLSSYSFVADQVSTGDFSFENGCPLSKK